MNFSNTNFPRSYHAPRDTVTRSRQAVTTVITFLPPSFRYVFLSHNQVTILIAFAFLTLNTALSPARFVGRNADPSPSSLPLPSHLIPSLSSSSRGRFKFVRFHYSLAFSLYPCRLLSFNILGTAYIFSLCL